eukprot:2956987-Prymnesium_polylepis.1
MSNTDGACSNLKASVQATNSLGTAAIATRSCTAPMLWAGVWQCISLPERTTASTRISPNKHDMCGANSAPRTTTNVLPAVGPSSGCTL